MLNLYNNIYKDKIVLITGHTGFVGTWLSLWLHKLGAKVIGFSLEHSDNDTLFKTSDLDSKILSIYGDINNTLSLNSVFEKHNPHFVFHLAAQPIVRVSYDKPLETFSTNVLGTINVLENIRLSNSIKGALIITTDKVYEEKKGWQGYRENDPLRGSGDPYSCSKACAEIAVDSYRKSFFKNQKKLVATARAGNILGGGDFGADRILADCINSLKSNEPIKVRNPNHVRPWQFILDVIHSYLTIGQKLLEGEEEMATAWNIGPQLSSVVTVSQLANEVISAWGGGSWLCSNLADAPQKKESPILTLEVSKAYFELNLAQKYNIKETVYHTVNWYKRYDGKNSSALCLESIEDFERKLSLEFSQDKTIQKG